MKIMTKKLTLREAKTPAKLDQFIEEHPSTGDMEQFDAALDSIIARKKPKAPRS